MTNSKICI